MTIYERQPADEVRALARLMMVDEEALLEKAQLVQEGLTSLDEMGFQTYHFLMGILLAKQNKEPLPFEPDEDEEEDEEEEDDGLTDEEREFEERWGRAEDDAESLAIQRAIDKGWW